MKADFADIMRTWFGGAGQGNMMTYRLWLPQGRQACQDNLRSAKLRRQCWLLVWAAWSHAGRVGEIYGGI